MEALERFRAEPQQLRLPSAPAQPIIYDQRPTVRSRASMWIAATA